MKFQGDTSTIIPLPLVMGQRRWFFLSIWISWSATLHQTPRQTRGARVSLLTTKD